MSLWHSKREVYIERDAQNHLYRTSWVIWYPCNMAVEYLSWEIYLMLWNIHIFGLYVFWCSVVPGDDFCGEGTITNKSVKIKDQGLRLFFIHYLDITRSFIMFSLLLLKSKIIIYYIILMYIFTNIFYLDNHCFHSWIFYPFSKGHFCHGRWRF